MKTNQEKQAHAEAIAHALGATFTARHETENGSGDVTMPDGVVFWMSVGGWAGPDTVHIGTRYPQHETGASRFNQGRMLSATSQRDFDRTRSYADKLFDGINLTASKSPEQAAKDILRRFMPTYAPLYAMAVEYCAKQSAYLDAWEANDTSARAAAVGIAGLSVDYIGRDYVTFKATVSPENIAKLADFMRTLAP